MQRDVGSSDCAPDVSCIVVAYDMVREIQRTLATLEEIYQRGAAGRFEVVVVDNGSRKPVTASLAAPFGTHIRVLDMPGATVSPAGALNYGAEHAGGRIIVGMIDGARMLTPGCIEGTLRAFRLFDDPVVTLASWHLGPGLQGDTVGRGYTKDVEDTLLSSLDWRADGYALYDLCEAADPSSERALDLGPLAESNFVAVGRARYQRLGGFDSRFTSPGGGLVNHDFLRRASAGADAVVHLLGEATFHQVHGGVATNVDTGDHPWAAMNAEYASITGAAFEWPSYCPFYLGRLSQQEVLLRQRRVARAARSSTDPTTLLNVFRRKAARLLAVGAKT